MTDNFANELAKASGITNKIEYTGSIAITQSKPNYNVTFTNGVKTIGRIDMNSDEMTFEGDADASAKKFMDFLAGCFAQRLKEEREKEREACAKVCEDVDAAHEGDYVLAKWCAAAIRGRQA